MTQFGITPYDQLPPYISGGNPMFHAQQFQQYNAFANVNTGNPLIDLAIQFGAPSIANYAGGTPMGFSHMVGGNMYNNLRMQNFSRQHSAMMQRAAMSNTSPMMDNIRALSAAADIDISDPDYQVLLEKAVRGIGLASPFISTTNMDRLTGGRNLAGLSSGIAMAGRNMYDPLTGRYGMSITSSESVARNLFNQMGYEEGPNSWRRNTTGVGAGALGDLFGEMSSRGMISPMSGTGPDITKLKSQLGDMTKAVGAVREIFGDAGVTNAPMRQLMSALEDLTQGGVYQIDPNRTNMMLRQLRGLANEQGMGMEGAFRMMMAGQQQAAQLGLVPTGVWTGPAAIEAISLGLGLKASGALAIPSWGRQTPEQLVARQQSLYLRNAASPMGNSMGALSRISQQFSTNKELAAVVEQLQAGTTPMLGGQKFDEMSASQVKEWISATTGIPLGQVEDIYEQKTTNEEYLNRLGSGAAKVGFAGARKEFIQVMMGRTMEYSADAIVTRALGKRSGKLSESLHKAAMDAMLIMPSDVAARSETRNAWIGSKQYDYVKEMADKGDTDAQEFLRHMERQKASTGISVFGQFDAYAGSMYGAGEQGLIDMQLIDPSDRAVNFMTSTAPDVTAASNSASTLEAFRSMLGSALAGETMTPDLVQNAVEALQKSGLKKTKQNFIDMAMKALKIEGSTEMAGRVKVIMGKIYEAEEEFLAAEERLTADVTRRPGESDKELKERTSAAVEHLRREREAVSTVYDEWNDMLHDPANKELLKKVEEETKSEDPDIDGEDGDKTLASLKVDTIRITVNGSEVVFSKPTVEVESSGGRKGSGHAGSVPPTTGGVA